MDKYFDEGLKNVKEHILQIVSMVENSLAKALEALKGIDVKIAEEVREIDRRIDRAEIALEEECIELIARHQPVGSDLRFLIGTIKMNNDLERMGDHAVNIADCVKLLVGQPSIAPVTTIWKMAEVATGMLKESVEGFIDNDAEKAQKVCEKDNIVDDMRDEVVDFLMKYMVKDPQKTVAAIQYSVVARNLERLADLSTNVCEDVIYIAQARIIKHHAETEQNH